MILEDFHIKVRPWQVLVACWLVAAGSVGFSFALQVPEWVHGWVWGFVVLPALAGAFVTVMELAMENTAFTGVWFTIGEDPEAEDDA